SLSGLTLTGTSAINYVLSASGNQSATTADINPAVITVQGVWANNKVYDGTTSIVINTSMANLVGKVSGDDLAVSAIGTLADPNVGNLKPVTISGFTLTGSSASNYVVGTAGTQTSSDANVVAKPITVTG